MDLLHASNLRHGTDGKNHDMELENAFF